ncbi:unnamed protein product [Euphydryas editha]|uniref:Uncharacterized protein n=1 Tax=Euphydryas editha TaxID=104508 RepID=A0AAU9TKW4_EUPED|nr:unnamed protein product [Euphydryas editha]CAH2086375.1 unnamed protein product [Euphydryas editha]CAH2086376.1 unnamed protein product [Euphydryas editha]
MYAGARALTALALPPRARLARLARSIRRDRAHAAALRPEVQALTHTVSTPAPSRMNQHVRGRARADGPGAAAARAPGAQHPPRPRARRRAAPRGAGAHAHREYTRPESHEPTCTRARAR